jgi:hypothetical protein
MIITRGNRDGLLAAVSGRGNHRAKVLHRVGKLACHGLWSRAGRLHHLGHRCSRWDLAQATDQRAALDATLAAHVLAFAEQAITRTTVRQPRGHIAGQRGGFALSTAAATSTASAAGIACPGAGMDRLIVDWLVPVPFSGFRVA